MPAETLAGKKVLILGGGFLHKQLAEAAKKMGVITYVIDPDDVVHSPAKLIADKYYDIDIYDIEAIVELCETEKIDGAVVGYYHAPYGPYIEICKRMGYPCLATERQYELFVRKDKFAEMCKACGADMPRSYQESDITEDFDAYPIIVKPVDSRGSKGQSVCYGYDETRQAITFAKDNSSCRQMIIEEYLPTKKEMTIEGLIKNGRFCEYLIQDMYYGADETGLGRVYKLITISERSVGFYKEMVKQQIEKMIRYAGIVNGVCTLQGKKENGKFKFYDASLRCGGGRSASFIEKVHSISVPQILIKFALTGVMEFDTEQHLYEFGHKIMVIWHITVNPGKICEVIGFDKICNSKYFVAYEERMWLGDVVKATGDVRQIFGAFVFAFDSEYELNEFWENEPLDIIVLDENGKNMVVDDTDRCRKIIKYRESEVSERI